MTAFEQSIQNFIKKAKKNPELVVRQVTIKLYSQIIMAGPVDKGRFRMNWQATYLTPATGVLIGDDPTGRLPRQRSEHGRRLLAAGATGCCPRDG